jgi:hypothetical protein
LKRPLQLTCLFDGRTMRYKLSKWHLATIVVAAAVVGATTVVYWPAMFLGARIFAVVAIVIVSASSMRTPYEMELQADGTVMLCSILGQRVVSLREITLVAARRNRGNAYVVVRSARGLAHLPIYMPGLGTLIEAVRAANPNVIVEGRF